MNHLDRNAWPVGFAGATLFNAFMAVRGVVERLDGPWALDHYAKAMARCAERGSKAREAELEEEALF